MQCLKDLFLIFDFGNSFRANTYELFSKITHACGKKQNSPSMRSCNVKKTFIAIRFTNGIFSEPMKINEAKLLTDCRW